MNSINNTSSFSIPPAVSLTGKVITLLTLGYNSGSGNGVFGQGRNISLSSIQRKTDKSLRLYLDSVYSDIFLFSGAEDLVPKLKKTILAEFDLTNENENFEIHEHGDYVLDERDSVDGLFRIRNYIARIEGPFAKRLLRFPESFKTWITHQHC